MRTNTNIEPIRRTRQEPVLVKHQERKNDERRQTIQRREERRFKQERQNQ